MGPRSVRTCAIGLLLLLLGAAGAAVSAPPDAIAATGVTVSFSTDTVAIGKGASRTVILLIDNQSTSPLTDVNITFASDPGITAVPDHPPTGVGAGESSAIPVTVTFDSTTRSGATNAVVTFGRGGSGRSAVVSTLQVKDEPPATAEPAPVTVEASAGKATLLQYQSTDVFFTIANTSDQPQKLTSATVSYPSSLSVSQLAPSGRTVDGANGRLALAELDQLGPGDRSIVHLHLDATDALQPGTALMVLSVQAVNQVNQRATTAVASQALTFEVLGESGVLTVLGVPALLFVPGLVFVLVLWSLWTYVWPRKKDATAKAGLDAKSITLWVFALLPTLSLPFLYPAITGWLGERRDYRRSYGLDDILYVWLLAAGMALALWAAIVVVRTIMVELFVPQEGQTGLKVLSVFALRCWDRSLEREAFTSASGQELALLRRQGDGRVLVAPLILYDTGKLDGKDLARFQKDLSKKPMRTWFLLLNRRKDTNPDFQQGAVLKPAVLNPADLTKRDLPVVLLRPRS
ncbi:hypothetical protein GA0111570_11443 [Raineyella antarctica]|uniref:Uncharacterized protein n=1 Tax=Raineyella antarctica TaxID=1577474 RepID=A0A1G6I5F7_9ACTN|nr:hypothetical protein [Raineyella antarctica]SDC01769.1 hypothetical protein GA0111570_11443 [Raineyella antarctica]